jgi:Flp pilus assembly CpaF family ATPase
MSTSDELLGNGVAGDERAGEKAPLGLGVVLTQPSAEIRYRNYLGPLVKYLGDPDVTVVRVNADGCIWYKKFGVPKQRAPETMSEDERAALIRYLANLEYGRAIDRLHSRLQCDLPIFGSRAQCFAPPISPWTMVLRNHRKHVVPWNDWRATAAADQNREEGWRDYPERKKVGWFEAIDEAIAFGFNIGIGGGTESGKTTFLNTALDEHAEIRPDDRLVIVQDRLEVQGMKFGDRIALLTRVEQAHHERNGSVVRSTYEFSDALEDALRCDLDTGAWGEVREERSGIGLVLAANTGTRGLKYTIHCNGPADVPQRFEDLFLLAGRKPVPRMIAKLCQLIVYTQRDETTHKGRVVDVRRVMGVDDEGRYQFESIAPAPYVSVPA